MRSLMFVFMLACNSVFAAPKVLFMVSDGFYAPEYYEPLKIFKKAGFTITTAAKYNSSVRPDRRQVDQYPSVNPDITFDKVVASKYDAIVFAGGNGAWEDFFPNENVHKLLTHFMTEGKVTALLCSSTGLLGVANNLSGSGKPIAVGRKATGYKRVKGLLVELGKVEYFSGESGKPFVIVDQNLITGRDPLSSKLFGETVVKVIKAR
ncbi:MAG: DJ-1/PfpI family protein [Halobacteriovoraceae bacterium]|nr:DJ-1/PfpI family protein [Halobacteriovoraceae bacterium]MCB9095547.1 DJ-1/PfpI family protein [Halobacteriovoraceae bacterium]